MKSDRIFSNLFLKVLKIGSKDGVFDEFCAFCTKKSCWLGFFMSELDHKKPLSRPS